MDEYETEQLEKVRTAMKDPNVALHLTPTFTHGTGVQVKIKSRKIGPIFFPHPHQTIADVLHMLGTLINEDVAFTDANDNEEKTDVSTGS